MILCSSSKLFTAALQGKRMKSKLKKMINNVKTEYIMIHTFYWTLCNFERNELGMFIYFPMSQIAFFLFTILSCFLCWLFSASKGRLYCSLVYIFFHISSKRTVPRMEIHLLESYSVWHEIAAWDIVKEAGGVKSQGKCQKSINSSME